MKSIKCAIAEKFSPEMEPTCFYSRTRLCESISSLRGSGSPLQRHMQNRCSQFTTRAIARDIAHLMVETKRERKNGMNSHSAIQFTMLENWQKQRSAHPHIQILAHTDTSTIAALKHWHMRCAHQNELKTFDNVQCGNKPFLTRDMLVPQYHSYEKVIRSP